MAETSEKFNHNTGKKRRKIIIICTASITALYIFGIYRFTGLTLTEFRGLDLNEQGDFLAGTFSGLAFLWFVAALVFQSFGLAQNSRALELQANELRNSVEAASNQADSLSKTTGIHRADLFISASEKYANELSSVIYSSMMQSFESRYDRLSVETRYNPDAEKQEDLRRLREELQRIPKLWKRFAEGDGYIFFRTFDEKLLKGAQPINVVSGLLTEIRYGPNFFFTFKSKFEEYIELLYSLGVSDEIIKGVESDLIGKIYFVIDDAIAVSQGNWSEERATRESTIWTSSPP